MENLMMSQIAHNFNLGLMVLGITMVLGVVVSLAIQTIQMRRGQ